VRSHRAGRLVWALTAYALHCRRIQGLAELSRISLRTTFGQRRWEPLIAMRRLRYPDVLGQNAGRAYEDYREWLQGIDFVADRYPLFAREREASFDEADLVLAMRSALEGGRIYSAALDSDTVRRLADHILDPACRSDFANTFRTTEAELNQVLEDAFAAVETDQHRLGRPGSIFDADD
jgi:hypothetical protein